MPYNIYVYIYIYINVSKMYVYGYTYLCVVRATLGIPCIYTDV